MIAGTRSFGGFLLSMLKNVGERPDLNRRCRKYLRMSYWQAGVTGKRVVARSTTNGPASSAGGV